MRYLSVCSGIEAATMAWYPLGWEPVAFSEIEKFPSAVLAHHYPTVPNWGDMTRFREWPDAAIDVLVGGTPCQSFSVAGLRKGLADPRGNLALTYLAVADRYRPRWVVWENVPGVLSATSHDAPDPCAPPDDLEEGAEWVGEDEYDADESHAFACFLAGLSELGYGFAYRSLDAQYAGLAQRRERVFVVGHLGDWRRAAAVLFERESLSGHPAPRREAGQVAPTVPSRSTAGGGLGTDFDCDGGLIAFGGNNTSGPIDVATAVNAHGGPHGRQDFESETFIAHALRADGFDASEDGTGRGTPLVPVEPYTLAIRGRGDSSDLEARQDGTANALLTPNGGRGGIGVGAVAVPIDLRQASRGEKVTNNRSHGSGGAPGHGVGEAGDPAFTVSERGQAIAFTAKDYGADAGDIAPTLRAGGHTSSHANGGVMPAVAFDARQSDVLQYGEKTGPLDTDGHTMAVLQTRGSNVSVGDISGTLWSNADRASGGAPMVQSTMQVRRLTPVECARLQGFPDSYLDIPYRGKPAADGPKYKALGNSFAVPVVRWIGERIKAVEEACSSAKAAS